MQRIALAALVLGAALAVPKVTSAGNVHFIGTPTCSQVGSQLCCSGKVAGLGTAPTNVVINATFSCTNQGGNQPPGQASGQSGPITPRGGQITFTNICTAAGRCPDTMTPTFGPNATINIFQNNNLVFSATVPVS
jgi:hypothetical protein